MTLAALRVRVDRGRRTVLSDVSLAIGDAERVAIIGPNGSGKSTLLQTLAGRLRPKSGTLQLNGRGLSSWRGPERAAHLGFLGQRAETPPPITVRERVELGRHGRGRGAAEAARTVREVDAAIEACGLAPLAHRRLDRLSGGEHQRARVATLLAQDPALLLLDEPLAGLDIRHQLDVLHVLSERRRLRGRSFVCVLHEFDRVVDVFDRVIVLEAGLVVADGSPRDVMSSEVLARVFAVDASWSEPTAADEPAQLRVRRPHTKTSAGLD